MRSKKLMKGYVKILSSNLIYSLSSVFWVFLYARFGSVEDAARLGLAVGVIGPLQLFFSMQSGVSILSNNLTDKQAYSLRVYLAPIFILIAAIASVFINDGLIIAVASLRLMDMLYETHYYGMMRNDGQGLLISVTCRFFILALFSSGLIRFGISIEALFLLAAVVELIFVALTLKSLRLEKFSKCKVFLKNNWQLGAGALMASLAPNIPRYYLAAHHATRDLAVYSNVITFVMGASILFSSFSNVWISRLDIFCDTKNQFKKIFLFYLLSNFIGLIFLNERLSNFLITAVFGGAYSNCGYVVWPFFVYYTTLFLQNIGSVILIAYRRNGMNMVSSFLSSMTVIISVYLFGKGDVIHCIFSLIGGVGVSLIPVIFVMRNRE